MPNISLLDPYFAYLYRLIHSKGLAGKDTELIEKIASAKSAVAEITTKLSEKQSVRRS